MTKEMFEWITKWQKEVFTKATPYTAAKHLQEEVGELIHDVANEFPKERTVAEYADCFLLLFGSASLYGLSYDEICQAINDKMEINKQRKWGKINDKGYIKHIAFKKGDIVFLKEDLKKERYTVMGYTNEISRGPVRQFEPSQVVSVVDSLSKTWQFREDSLQFAK